MIPRVFIFSALILGVCHAEEPVFIDDHKLAAEFESKLGQLAQDDQLLTLDTARQEIERNQSKKIPIPEFEIPSPDSKSLYEKCASAVVAIGTVYQCRKCDKWHQDGFSTGWLASPDGLVVTNAHLFEGNTEDGIGVMTRDGRVFPVKEILAADRNSDIAILQIDTGGKKLPALPLAATASPGEEISVISHPQGRLYCLTSGKISRFHRQSYEENTSSTDWMSITADFAAGSSGGPVLNTRGEVVGMVSSTLTAYSDDTDCKNHPVSDVQMIFKDCVPLTSLRAMFLPRDSED